jgi:TRAP-type C4-dicarboxylate transport system permease large subunit
MVTAWWCSQHRLAKLTRALWTTAQNAETCFLIIALSSVLAWAICIEKIPDHLFGHADERHDNTTC